MFNVMGLISGSDVKESQKGNDVYLLGGDVVCVRTIDEWPCMISILVIFV